MLDQYEVCVITAKGDELAFFTPIFDKYFGRGRPINGGSLYLSGKAGKRSKPGRSIFLGTCGGMGNVLSASRAAEIAMAHSPTYFIFSGTAGSLAPTLLRLGDVVVPPLVFNRPYQRICAEGERDYDLYARAANFREHFFADSALLPIEGTIELPRASHSALSRMDKRKLADGLAEHCASIPLPDAVDGQCARGAEVVDDMNVATCGLLINSDSYRDFFLGQCPIKTAAIDMESFGFMRAWQSLSSIGKPFIPIIIRGISDYAGKRTALQKDKRWNEAANRNAATVAAEFIVAQG